MSNYQQELNISSIKKHRFVMFLFFSLIVLFLTALVSTRDVSVGADTQIYIDYFNGIKLGYVYRYEPIFILLSKFSAFVFPSYHFFFALIFLIFNIGFFTLYQKIINEVPDKRGEFANWSILLGCLLFSSWYLTGTTNGLRNGVSLPYLYLGLIYFTNKEKFKSVFFILISIGLHLSTVLVLPFIALFFIPSKLYWSFFFLLAVFYPLGINEYFIKFFSDISGTKIYELMNSYADGQVTVWQGFSPSLYLYTLGWLLIFLLLSKFVKRESILTYFKIVKIYSLLMMPYLVFGFGAFSNRYAFISWLFIPIVQAVFLVCSKFNLISKLIFGASLFSLGFTFFLSRFYFI